MTTIPVVAVAVAAPPVFTCGCICTQRRDVLLMLPVCGMRLEFGNIKGQAQGDSLHRCLSLFYLIASSWCVCVCVLGAVFTICSEIDTYL